jgi:hypothetical protein
VMAGKAQMPRPFATFGFTDSLSLDRWKNGPVRRIVPSSRKRSWAEDGYPNGFVLKFANVALFSAVLLARSAQLTEEIVLAGKVSSPLIPPGSGGSIRAAPWQSGTARRRRLPCAKYRRVTAWHVKPRTGWR